MGMRSCSTCEEPSYWLEEVADMMLCEECMTQFIADYKLDDDFIDELAYRWSQDV